MTSPGSYSEQDFSGEEVLSDVTAALLHRVVELIDEGVRRSMRPDPGGVHVIDATEIRCPGCERRCECRCGCRAHSHWRHCSACSTDEHRAALPAG